MYTISIHQLPGGWASYPYTDDGYRVNYTWKMAVKSILMYENNEFWMIWSEILFTAIFLYLYATTLYTDMSIVKQVCCNLMYSAAIFCRLCSFVYHTFNCLSVDMNRSLLNIDLIGIASNALGIPWVVCLYFDKHYDDSVYIKHLFGAYFLIFFWMYIDTNIYYIKSFLTRKRAITNNLSSIYLVGNIMTGIVIMDDRQSDDVRFHLFQAQLYMISGYIFFYILRFPECCFGYSKIINSHLLWHVFTFIGQYCFIATVYF